MIKDRTTIRNNHLKNMVFAITNVDLGLLQEEIQETYPSCWGVSQYAPGKIEVHFPKSDITKPGDVQPMIDAHDPPMPRDFKAEIAAASTMADKQNIILEKLGLK